MQVFFDNKSIPLLLYLSLPEFLISSRQPGDTFSMTEYEQYLDINSQLSLSAHMIRNTNTSSCNPAHWDKKYANTFRR